MNEDKAFTLIVIISIAIGIFAVGVPLDIYLLHLGVFCGAIGAAVGLAVGLSIYRLYCICMKGDDD